MTLGSKVPRPARHAAPPRPGRRAPRFLAALALLPLWAAAARARPRAASAAPQDPVAREVHFSASDGVRLAATYIPAAKSRKTFILLHGVGAGKGEWGRFAQRMAEKGIGSLAVDFRGHGLSGGPAYTTFRTAGDWAVLQKDVAGAVEFLSTEGVLARNVGVVGGSIGANLALKAADKDKRIAAVGLLSPGLDYQGVTIEAEAGRFKRPLFIGVSRTDPYSADSVMTLKAKVPPAAKAQYSQAMEGHGAQMLDSDLGDDLLAWIDEQSIAKP